MRCNVCGTENPDGLSVCNACGAPLIAPVQNQNESEQEQPVVQEVKPEQPQPAQNQQSQYGQPQGMQNQFAQPQFAQPQFAQNQYGQPQGMQGQYNMPPKEKKPLSKGAKIGIISGLAAVLLIGIFFIFIFPILTRAKLGGSYVYESSYGDEYYLFDDGVYVNYEIEGSDDKYYYSIGTYTVKDETITLKELDGDEKTFKFNAKKNIVTDDWKDDFKSSDKKAKLDTDISKDYLDGLEDTIISASNAALKNSDVYEEATWYGSYFIYQDDLKNPYTDFEEELAKQLNYSSSNELQFLLEEMDLAFDISVSSSGVVTVEIY